MTDPIDIRPAEAGEAADVTALVQEAFAVYTPEIGKPPAPALYDYAALIATGQVCVAARGSDILGVLYTYVQQDGGVMLDVLAVDARARGEGLARRLTHEAEARAHAQGAQVLRVYTNEVMEGPLRMYPKLGFRETHRAVSDGYSRVHFEKPLMVSAPDMPR